MRQGLFTFILLVVALVIAFVIYNFLPEYIKKGGPLVAVLIALSIMSVVGARPNFMKLAPLARALDARADARHVIVHTGQHYDEGMSGSFFDDLGIPEPGHNLGIGSASHAQQTAGIMQRIEPVLLDTRPDVILVYGDVNSTVAAALVASKLGVRVALVEAGLRSRVVLDADPLARPADIGIGETEPDAEPERIGQEQQQQHCCRQHEDQPESVACSGASRASMQPPTAR